MFITAAEPAAARGPEAAPVKACATHATSFTAESGDGGPVTLRMGCAQDAGALRPLAKSDDDLVMAFDFHVPEGRQQVRDLTRTLVEETRADQRAGMSLAESFTKRAQRDSVGVYPPQGGGPDFDGQVHAVDDSLVLIAPAGDIGTAANWWQKWIAAGVSLGITIASSAVCLLAFNVGAPAAAPVCGAVGGALGALVGELMNAYFDGRSLGDADVWNEALAVATWGAVGGAFAGQLMNWVAAGTTSLITRVQVSLRHFATRIKAFGDVLTFMVGSMEDIGPKLLEALERLRGIGGTGTPLRVMVVRVHRETHLSVGDVRRLAEQTTPHGDRHLRRRGGFAAPRLASPVWRIRAARIAGIATATATSWPKALAHYTRAVDLLGEVVTRQLSRPDREHGLVQVPTVATEAGAIAFTAGQPETALVLLERGRALMHSQNLDLHSDLQALREAAPDLVERLGHVASELARAEERLAY